MSDSHHRSLVATAATTDPQYTSQERANIELILALRAAPFAERRRFLHPDLRHHRRGFAFLAELAGLGPAGYTALSISDRVDTIEDIVAKDDRVWAVWTLHGRHTGPCSASRRPAASSTSSSSASGGSRTTSSPRPGSSATS